MKKFKTKLDKANVSKWIACHLMGQEHTNAHRITIGIVIILTGVILVEEQYHMFIVNIAIKTVGVVCHAVGAIPIINPIESKKHLDNHQNIIS